jgi:hypothetical protein
MSSNPSLSQEKIKKYRERTYRFLPELRIHSESQAVNFLNERKFIFFWPIQGIPLPSLWGATAGDRPVPNNHDDPGHITWRWKDNLLNQKKWYYAKILRRKSTIISLDMVEYFITICENAFHTIEDFEYLHRIGNLSRIELEIYSLLLSSGPLDSISLRERIRTLLTFSSGEFDRSLENLQKNLQILPIGISEKGRWRYAYLYDTVEHYFPKKIINASNISMDLAREMILSAYFLSNGIATINDVKKLLGWEICDIQQTLDSLLTTGIIHLINSEGSQQFFHKELLK